MILFACDLDNTLIYSYKKAAESSICVETMGEKELSYMTPRAYSLLQEADRETVFVPVTTRSIEQYRRIRLLKNGFPKYALTSNGGVLLVDNDIDEAWSRDTAEIIKDSMEELHRGIEILSKDPAVVRAADIVDGVFVFTKTRDVAGSTWALKSALDMEKVSVDSNGEKIYIIPKALDKGTAVRRIKKLLNIGTVICAGDSCFDIPMLQAASMAFVPRCSEIDSYINNAELKVCESEGMKFAESILEDVIAYSRRVQSGDI